MKQISVLISLVILVSCSHSSDRPFVSKHDTINVYYIDPRNGSRGWSKGVYDTKRIFQVTDSTGTSGKWLEEKAWQVGIPDSFRDAKTNIAKYDSVHKTWLSIRYYNIDRHLVQPDSLPYKN